jgi:hypothetical protein
VIISEIFEALFAVVLFEVVWQAAASKFDEAVVGVLGQRSA